MARGLPLGPSVASWPMETSTAHDIFLLWAMGFAAFAAIGDTIFTTTISVFSGPCLNLYATTILLNVFNSCPSIIISKNRIMCSQDIYYLHRSDPKPLLYVVKQTPSSYKSIAARTRAAVLLRVVLLKTRSLAMVHLSTLHSLMTVTILSSIDSFMEDPSSNRDLTCVKSPSSICLKALMEPLSISTIYLFVALGNVLLVYVLNSESFDLSFLCIWFFLD
ncbi:hypothetical protein AtNW77_Chr1g0041261 [Arabidopsis thaliana]|uniref:Beta-galactosidase related protein n=2 Tax=Arabidopsis TaxID=3701 RepID=F4I3A5_ARATH|nr:Beta-galactosidase related protein [Arabidopsis thaliana]AEE31886.1 Beta-galactosidase related protein [Arabidopsis thaliana]KAG7648614.1 hypothetical protein ISN45_At01g036150 [Arabidopsis thaliana x Arabidopsis arenosa]|eukprot:NP_174892.1 Beta-galactosidase related protein [Arabidopsis thaliana]